jgi:cobalt-zinc-cadmium efflux system outer membrane protein
MNKMIAGITLGTLCITPGCTWKRVKADKAFKNLQHTTQENLGYELARNQTEANELYEARLQHGISRAEAVGIALHNNARLQAQFESLGIAQADLVQAGLYSNPNFQAYFWLALQDSPEPEPLMDVQFSWNFADIWQVPIKKKISQAQLEITTLEISKIILEVFAQTKNAYNNCLFTQARLQHAHHMTTDNTTQHTQHHQQEAHSEVDSYLALIARNTYALDAIKHKSLLHTQFIQLRTALSLPPLHTPIVCTQELQQSLTSLPALEELEAYARAHQPEILIADLKVKKAEHEVRLQRTLFIPKVEAGITFYQQESFFKGVGPMFNLDLPFFDTNYAQVARAHTVLAQNRKEYKAVTSKVLSTIRTTYELVRSAYQEIEVYLNTVDLYKKIVDYQHKQHASNTVKRDYYTAQQDLINAYQKAADALVALEVAVGKNLDTACPQPCIHPTSPYVG